MAAGLLGIHACRVYDEADTERSPQVGGELTGGRGGTASGGEPPFVGKAVGGSGGSGGGGASAGANGGGRGGVLGAGGNAGGSDAEAGSPAEGGADSGTAGEGGVPGDAGSSSTGGSPTTVGGAPLAQGGGGGGSGGVPSGGNATGGSPVAPELIDDGEDANNRISVNDGRNGYWSTFDEGAGCVLSPASDDVPFMTEASSGKGNGDYALHFTSSGGGAEGCGANLEFTSPVKVYDASQYVGVSFFGRSQVGEETLLFRVVVDATDPRFELCDPEAAPNSMMQCYDHFLAPVALTTEWSEHVVLFDTLTQEGWGYSAGAFQASKIVAVQWLAKPGSADVWIDDVKFVAE